MSLIEVNKLVKQYNKSKTPAVDGVSFSVKEGEFFAFLGPNGAGKTTTISILTTTLSMTSGSVKIAGYERGCRRSLKIVVDNASKAEHLLKTTVSPNLDVMADGTIVLYEHLDDAARINHMLVSNGLAVSALAPGEQALESYFMDLMGEGK